MRRWRTNAKGQLVLASSGDPQVQKFIGETVLGVMNHDGRLLPPEVLLARRSPRWVLDDVERRQYLTDGAAFAKAVQQDAVRLRLAESGATVDVRTVPRGVRRAGLDVLADDRARAGALSGRRGGRAGAARRAQPALRADGAVHRPRNLLFIGRRTRCRGSAAERVGRKWTCGCASPSTWSPAAACVHALTVHPRRLPFQGLISVSVWAVGIVFDRRRGLQRDPRPVVVDAGDALGSFGCRLPSCSPGRTASSRTRWPS